MHLIIDTQETKRLARDLKRFAKRGVAYATRNTLNDLAFEARKQWRSEMESSFVLRNKWTLGSIRVDTAKGSSVQTMQSRVGSLAEYMGIQESGGTKSGGGRGVRVPTAIAAGQGMGSRRTKPVRGPHKMSSLQLARVRQRSGAGTRQQVAAAIRQTIAAGKRFLFLDADRARQGMYKLVGGKRRPRLQLVWDMSSGSVQVPATPTLATASAKARRKIGKFATHRIREQLRRAKVIGY